MKINKLIKKKKLQSVLATGLLLAGIVGGSYYLLSRQDNTFSKTEQEVETTTDPTTDPEIQENIEKKKDASPDEVITTPPTVAEEPNVTTLKDVSLTIMRDGDQAYVSIIGPTGTYGAEKLVNNSWVVIESGINHSSVGGGSGFDIITSADTVTHYRIFKLEEGTRTAISGDTSVTWQEILSKGILTVPLAE